MINRRRMGWERYVTRMGGGERDAYRVLALQLDGKRPLGRRKHRWEDNNKMDPREYDGVIWTGLIWLRIGTSGGLL
jgi:hypothetical protein